MLRDGRLRIPMMLMDGAAHRPGFRYPARATKDELKHANASWREPGMVDLLVRDAGLDAAREAILDAYDEYNNDLTNRWRSPAKVVDVTTDAAASGGAGAPPEDARERAYAAYDAFV